MTEDMTARWLGRTSAQPSLVMWVRWEFSPAMVMISTIRFGLRRLGCVTGGAPNRRIPPTDQAITQLEACARFHRLMMIIVDRTANRLVSRSAGLVAA